MFTQSLSPYVSVTVSVQRATAIFFALAASAAAAQTAGETPRLDVRSISGPLGLIDVSVASGAASVYVESRVDGGDPPLRVPLRETGDDRWTGRVMLASEDAPLGTGIPIELRVVTSDRGEEITGRWRSFDASPPEDQRPPAWALGTVWYQVFPERFANGNPLNDPAGPDTTELAWDEPFGRATLFEVEQSWSQHAVEPRFHRPIANHGPAGVRSTTTFRRRYGGDLQGVVERLDHLERLGVTGIYFCPIFHGQSLHKYDAADHRHIDPNLAHPGEPGSVGDRLAAVSHDANETEDPSTWEWTAADRYFLDTLLPAARERGMRVMLDGVWNHTGLWNWAFMDVVERGARSPYAEWFECRFDADGALIGWQGWSNVNGSLPEFHQTDDGDLHPGVKAFVFDVTRRWMDPNGDGDPSDGIDGWRLDVANEVGRTFWRDWRALVRSINPDALIVGELWFPGGTYFDGTAFDAQMNYPFAYQVTSWLAGDGSMTSAQLARGLERVYINEPFTDLMHLTLVASHDTERAASLMQNPGRGFDQAASPFASNGYDAGPPSEESLSRSVLAAVLQATLPGGPMIYNGDEFGMAGADDPDNRRPIVWTQDGADEGGNGVLTGYQTWFLLRRDAEIGPLLRFGDWESHETSDENIFAVSRSLNGRSITVLVNRANEAREVPTGLPLPAGSSSAPIARIPAFSSVFWTSSGRTGP